MTLDENLTSVGCPVEPAHTIYSNLLGFESGQRPCLHLHVMLISTSPYFLSRAKCHEKEKKVELYM